MNVRNLTQGKTNKGANWWKFLQPRRRRHDPMLVLNISRFNFRVGMESRLQSGSAPGECLVLKMNTTHSSSLAAEVPAYAQLQREMHDALGAQHPDWILPNGDCPTCDSYDARFAELLIVSLATERALAHRPNNLNLANTTKLPTFFVSHVGGRGHHPLATLGDPGNFSMPAGYAQPRKIVFPEMASAIRKCSHEKLV